MIQKLLQFLLMSVIVVFGATQVATQSLGEDVSISKDTDTFECSPKDVPSTSIIGETEKDIEKIIYRGSYNEKYPDKCRLWKKEYVMDDGEDKKRYVIEVMKYRGDRWAAVVKVERNGDGVAFADVDMEEKDPGATNPQGMVRTELPEDFRIEVSTSDGELQLEGSR